MYKKILKLIVCLVFLLIAGTAFAAPVTFTDSTGHSFTLQHPPGRVVCLVPSVTEMIFRVGGGRAVVGVTYHTTYPPEAALKPIVGGFFSPSLKRIAALHPDMIFASRLQKAVINKFKGMCPVVILEANSVADIYNHIGILGEIFNRSPEADRLIRGMKKDFNLLKRKTDRIPVQKRKRVIRLMGRNTVMAPGDDSFQNEYIRLAGGIPPVFGKKGSIITVSKSEWQRFNPQVIYGCGGDRAVVKRMLSRPGWRDVAAVKNKAIYFFPCDLTCRASTHAAYFAGWLSSTLYGDWYAKKANQVVKDHLVSSIPVPLPFGYVKSARVLTSRVFDFMNKTLLLSFRHPVKVLSTLEGPRDGISAVGNHYLPPQLWNISYRMGFRTFQKAVYKVLRVQKTDTSLLMTGADMDNLSVQTKRFKAMRVTALVTAGVRSNAVRMSKDTGRYYEPGTINILLLTNCRLTPRAMARAVISATEGKTAALQDLDIRSAATGKINQATGTGTDNILVVAGEGVKIDNAGGHSKMGELIARAVYDGVREAVFRQNGITRRRNVFQRLRERKISLYDLIPDGGLNENISRREAVTALEKLLLEPEAAAFIETAFAVSDQAEIGLINSLASFNQWCRRMASGISGKQAGPLKDFVARRCQLPGALRMAFNALLNGIASRP
jgi:ABC-type Fe3+-hydroxamate transport system substrate-binding protein/adenosylcobinamide amidohydrolase